MASSPGFWGSRLIPDWLAGAGCSWRERRSLWVCSRWCVEAPGSVYRKETSSGLAVAPLSAQDQMGVRCGQGGPMSPPPGRFPVENTRGERAQMGRDGSLMNIKRCHTISTSNCGLSPLYSMQVLSVLENVESGASGQSQQQCLAPQPARWGQILRG